MREPARGACTTVPRSKAREGPDPRSRGNTFFVSGREAPGHRIGIQAWFLPGGPLCTRVGAAKCFIPILTCIEQGEHASGATNEARVRGILKGLARACTQAFVPSAWGQP